jgi:hypothetical protein
MKLDLLSKASDVLAREVSRLTLSKRFEAPVVADRLPSFAASGDETSVSGAPSDNFASTAGAPVEALTDHALGSQAHQLLASLLALAGQNKAAPGSVPYLDEVGGAFGNLAGGVCPITGAAVPRALPNKDQLRHQAHEFIESLLVTFNQATEEKAAPYADQVPLIRCVAPVGAGENARASLQVANDELEAVEVTLYSTNFVADTGHEIPSLRVTVLPRRATVPARGSVSFEIAIAVPMQAAAGAYSGLVQVMGSKYVKAVLSVEVL